MKYLSLLLLLCVAAQGRVWFSQKGSSGPVTPLTISGLVYDLNAKTGVVESGGNITSVTDGSGNGYDFTIGGTPTYNATGLNGFPTMVFSSANIKRIGLGGVTRTAFSFYTVLSYSAGAADNIIYYAPSSGGWGTAAGDTYLRISAGNVNSLDYWVDGSGANAPCATNTFNTGTVYMVLGTYDGTTLKIFMNGVLAGSAACASCKIGDRIQLNDGMTAKISESALWDKALSAGEISSLVTYSTTEWGLVP